MVDKLGPTLANAVAALQKPGATGATQHRASAGVRGRSDRRDAGAATLEQRVRQRVLALDPDDPQRRRKAFRLYMEARLMQEFGAELGAEAGFHGLVDDVVRAMELDADVKADIDEAVDRLLADTTRR